MFCYVNFFSYICKKYINVMKQEERLEEAKELYKTANADQRYVLESEDERIREDVLAFIRREGQHIDKYKWHKWIAWLENQADETKAKMFLISKGYPIDANGMFPTYEEMYNIIKEGIEKQNNEELEEQFDKMIEDTDTVDSNEDGLIAETIRSKFADKVEPKFKVGDWVVNKLGDSWHIDSFDKKNYQVSDGKGKYNYFPISKQDEMHIWTIKDAKDGDILVAENIIFIYKNAFASHIVSCCKLINDVFEPTVDARTCCEGNPYVHPASKEQRELLFAKMEEAGYTFDFEKKELKKIEQKPIDKVEPKFNIGDIIFNKKTKEQFTITGRSLALQYYHDEDHLHEVRFTEQDDWEIIKPKFHEGDWVVDNCGYVWKIEGILNQFYILEGVEGGESRPTIEWVDKTFHLWSIADAKDGDILATDKGSVFIYAKVLYNKPYAYCGVDKFGVFKDNCLENNWTNSLDNITPATREQRDALMKAMKDAGYTFDFEKKELEKIEQNNTEEYIETKGLSELEAEAEELTKEISDEIDGNKVVIKKGNQKPIEWSEDEKIRKEIANYFKHYSGGDNISIEFPKWIAWLEKQAAWSEEDKKMIFKICQNLYDYPRVKSPFDMESFNEAEKEVQFIKSLKPQPKQEWSEEDTETLNGIVNYLFTSTDVSSIEGSDKWYDWLKSLKNRVIPKQKWSEEDDNCLSTIIAEFSKCAGKSVSKDEWMRCNDFLNSIRDRVQSPPKQKWSVEDEGMYRELHNLIYSIQYYNSRKELSDWLESLKSRKLCVYNPYKAVVESIAKMCNKYKNRMSDEEEAKDFLANVAAKCREAAEYDKQYMEE